MYSDVIETVGTPTVAAGPVGDGAALLSFAYRYRHTAVLTEDVKGFSITVPGVQAPAGSPGYFAGAFGAYRGNVRTSPPKELWCFLPSAVGGKRDHICLLRSASGVAAIAPTRMNPYLCSSFSPATGTFDYVTSPVFERRRIEIPGDLTMEYRFEAWANGAAKVKEFAVGAEVREVRVASGPDGVAILRTVAGDLLIAPAEAGKAKAILRPAEPAPPST